MPDHPLAGRREAALIAALGVGLVFALWCVPYVGTHDGPNHLANCVLANQLEDPASPLHRWLELGAPVTNLGFQHVCEVFDGLFGWRLGYRLTLTTIALAFASGYFVLARALDRGSPVKCFGFCAALSWPFYMGFFDFVLGMGLAFFALAGVLHFHGRRLAFGIGLATVILASIHPFAAMSFGLITFLTLVLGAEPGRRLRAALVTAAAGTPGAALTLLARPEDEKGAAIWTPFFARAGDLAETFVGGPQFRAIPAALFAATCAVAGGMALVRGQVPKPRRGLAVVAVGLFVAFWVAPMHIPNWEYFSPRLGFTSLVLAPLAVPPAWLARPRIYGLAWGSTFVVAALGLAGAALHNLRMEPLLSEALAGLGANITRTGVRFPLFLDTDATEFRELQPTVALAHLYLFDQGGIDIALYAAIPSRDAILMKEKIEDQLPHWGRSPRNLEACGQAGSPHCEPLPVQHEWWTVFGLSYEDVLLFSSNPDIRERFALRGYQVDFEQGRLAILRAQRCTLELEVRASRPLSVERLRFTVRRPPLDVDSVVIDVKATALSEGTARLTSPGGECGPLEVRLEAAAPGAPTCEEADGGVLRASPRAGAPASVLCTLR